LSYSEVKKLFVHVNYLKYSFTVITIPYLYGFLYHLAKIFWPLNGPYSKNLGTLKNLLTFVTMGGSLFFLMISDLPGIKVCSCALFTFRDDNGETKKYTDEPHDGGKACVAGAMAMGKFSFYFNICHAALALFMNFMKTYNAEKAGYKLDRAR
jgi:hypothetical protein